MRTLVYKRTHKGDPDKSGLFGIRNCMGRVRGYKYDAVIGLGATTRMAVEDGIDGRINWIGIGPHYHQVAGIPDPVVTFDRFVLFDGDDAPIVKDVAKALARRFYSSNARILLEPTEEEQTEINEILKLAKRAKPSTFPVASVRKLKCPPKRKRPDC